MFYHNSVEHPFRVQPQNVHVQEWKFLFERGGDRPHSVETHGRIKGYLSLAFRPSNPVSVVGKNCSDTQQQNDDNQKNRHATSCFRDKRYFTFAITSRLHFFINPILSLKWTFSQILRTPICSSSRNLMRQSSGVPTIA